MSVGQIDPQTIKRRVVETAARLGAGAVRFVAVEPDLQTRGRMEAAFARGDLSTWGYDQEYARRATDPREILPDARSVVCIAVPYATLAPSERTSLRGRVSNYAWSTDYHRRLRALLAAVSHEIEEAGGRSSTAIVCDTQPLAERALAARAGLGWIGKHTNLIAPELGSFVFLGEIVTTVDLPADPPLRKSCGDCRRCVDACPTGALRGDYTIDADRCISDLTQRTGSIPLAMRALMGEWIWGCDLCQLVCPPTQMASRRAGSQWEPRNPETARPSLLALLKLRSGTFKRQYRSTAMGWRGAAVLRRNAAVALGNSLDRSAVEPLIESMRADPHPMVRGHAAWALGRIGSPRALEALDRQYGAENHSEVRNEIRLALESGTSAV